MALRDHKGNTPLHLVALNYSTSFAPEFMGAAEALLGARANPFAENKGRCSALSIACDAKNTKLQVRWRHWGGAWGGAWGLGMSRGRGLGLGRCAAGFCTCPGSEAAGAHAGEQAGETK